MDYRTPPSRPRVEMVQESPLADALETRMKMNRVRIRYGIKNPKDVQTPKIQWEGDPNG
jgi:hypothetical protein